MSNSSNKPKLCYILPDYRLKSHTHFAYLVDFVGEISNFFDIFLIIEKGERPQIDLGCQRVQVLWFQFLPLRWCELHCRLFYARLLGYRTFYIHYSFLSAFLSSLITRLVGGRTFYWNCGLPWQYRRGFLRKWFERLVYKMISFLVTGTEGLKKQYAEHYHLPLEKIKVMPNWINLEKIKNQKSKIKINELRRNLNINENQKVLLFVHRLSKRKGAHYLPEIVRQLESRIRNNELSKAENQQAEIHNSSFIILVIGDGPEREEIELKAKSYNLKANFRFLGWLPNEELPSYYSMADVFIMPSEEEGFPRVLLEAMASGTPFAAFDVGGVKEITPTEIHSYMAPVGNLDLFAANIKEILNLSPASRVRISELEKKWVEKYDIKKVAQSFSSII